MSKVLVIPDLHFPFVHPKALQFAKDVQRKYNTDEVVFIGDVVDLHAVSRFSPDPDGFSPGEEFKAAYAEVQKWVKEFPKAKVCIGNHDERLFRRAYESGLPRRAMRPFEELWDTPGWNWADHHFIDNVKYVHGTGRSGMTAAIRMAVDNRCSLVMGHTHTYAGYHWHTTEKDRIFGLNVGCLLDPKAYAMAYGKHFPTRPDLGMGVVDEGQQPHFIAMPMSRGEPYHREASRLSWTKRQRSLKR
jgi:UDP-2,3-diacylglucosamine pyrophosphatase LpxH